MRGALCVCPQVVMERLNVGIIGAGYWGKNLVRVFNAIPEARILGVADTDEQKLIPIRVQYPHLASTTNSDDMFRNPAVDAVLIATPVSTHFPLARRALDAGKHVWIEKPMTETLEEARTLESMSRERGLTLLVDHTFLFTSAVQKMKDLIDAGELSEIRYLDSERINLGLIQPDTNVVYDLAAHDISIFNHLLGGPPVSVHAIGTSHVTARSGHPVAEIAYVGLRYPGNVIGHIRVSWISPMKIRKMLVGGSRKMILYNDIEPFEKIKVYSNNVTIDFEQDTTFEPIYRSGDVLIPHLENNEALHDEALHFLECIREKKEPLTGAGNGIAVMKVLEAANESMRKNGMMVAIA